MTPGGYAGVVYNFNDRSCLIKKGWYNPLSTVNNKALTMENY